jgi:hypothetical protein
MKKVLSSLNRHQKAIGRDVCSSRATKLITVSSNNRVDRANQLVWRNLSDNQQIKKNYSKRIKVTSHGTYDGIK